MPATLLSLPGGTERLVRLRRPAAGVVVAVAGLALLLGPLDPVLRPLLHRGTLAPAAVVTPVGIPVPAVATRCRTQGTADPGGVLWCLPPDVSVPTLERWYAGALPAGHDAPGLRWCVEQVRGDGARRSVWAVPGGLVGYDLPPRRLRPGVERPPGGSEVVQVFSLPGRPCPPAARRVRTALVAPAAR